jgi:5'-3' exonuclease
LPGIGEKRAQQLIARFGERFLERCLSDNSHQFVQLMDENGEFIFSDKHTAQLSRALARTEITLGQSGY